MRRCPVEILAAGDGASVCPNIDSRHFRHGIMSIGSTPRQATGRPAPFPGTRMLSLVSTSSTRWLDQVDRHLDEILIDHAHCEKKAAGVAMNLLFSYVDRSAVARSMPEIVTEELDHFRLVLDLLERRGICFRKLAPGGYAQALHELIRRQEPHRAVDRLLVAGLIEARSCERFALLAEHVADTELRDFYRALFESEARHHTTYVQAACGFAPEALVRSRLRELAAAEAAIIDRGDPLPRMHS
jgi:tRNA-(ms[2]io[6]A)-hydroxylase